MRRLRIAAALVAMALGTGCFDVTATSHFQKDGTADVEAEIGVSMQMVAMIQGLSKDSKNADLLKDCENRPNAELPAGVRWVKGARGTRGDMLTCTVQFKVDDPVKAAAEWKTPDTSKDGTLEISEFHLDRLGDHAYRLRAIAAAKPAKPKDSQEANPFETLFMGALLNHYITVSISALRIENTTGELSADHQHVTWKIPVVMLLKPPPDYRQEIKADIIYDETWLEAVERWFDRALRATGVK
jgi:hypothetical protein